MEREREREREMERQIAVVQFCACDIFIHLHHSRNGHKFPVKAGTSQKTELWDAQSEVAAVVSMCPCAHVVGQNDW